MRNLYTASKQYFTRPKDERFETLDDMRAYLVDRQEKSRLFNFYPEKVKFESTDTDLFLSTGFGDLKISNWAFEQLKGVGLDTQMISRLKPSTAALVLNELFDPEQLTDGRFQRNLLSYDDTVLRAFIGRKYQTLWDAEVVQWVQEITANGNWFRPKSRNEDKKGPAGLYAGQQDMFIFMVDGGKTFEDGNDGGTGRGFFVWNTEVYGVPFGFKSFLFTEICGNHIVWNATEEQGFTMRHFGRGFLAESKKALFEFAHKYMNSAPTEQKAIANARQKVFSTTREDLAANLKLFGIGPKMVTHVQNYLQNQELEPTVWNVVGGLTRASQNTEFVTARNKIDEAAGKILATAL